MKKHVYTFLPGVGIYNIKTNSIYPIYSLDGAKRVFSLVSKVVTGDKGANEIGVVSDIVKEHGTVAKNTEASHEEISFNFNKIKSIGTRIFSNKKKINWKDVERVIYEYGFTLNKRNYISYKLTEMCPVYELVGENGEVISEGKGLTDTQARRSALAEAVERVVAESSPEEVLLGNAESVFDDNKYMFDPELGPRDSYQRDIVTEWVPSYDLINNQQTYFPADLAYYEYKPKNIGLKLFGFSHTTGLAAGSSIEEAAISAMFEVMERDAYWITMRTHINHPDIPLEEVADLDKKVIKIKNELDANGFDLVVKDMSIDWGVPIAHVVLIDRKGRIPAFTHGVGTGFCWSTAVQRGVTEVLQMYSGMHKLAHKHDGWKQIVSMDRVMGAPILAWSDPLFGSYIKHLVEPSNGKWNRDLEIKDFDEVKGGLMEKGYNLLITPLGQKAGLKVLRAWIDKATTSDERLERIGERLEFYRKKQNLKSFYTTPILT